MSHVDIDLSDRPGCRGGRRWEVTPGGAFCKSASDNGPWGSYLKYPCVPECCEERQRQPAANAFLFAGLAAIRGPRCGDDGDFPLLMGMFMNIWRPFSTRLVRERGKRWPLWGAFILLQHNMLLSQQLCGSLSSFPLPSMSREWFLQDSRRSPLRWLISQQMACFLCERARALCAH